MLFASPAAALKPRLHTEALFQEHFKSSAAMAVYLIGGGALATVSLLSVGYAAQHSGTVTALPYVAMAVMVLWFAVGAWLLNRQERQLQASTRNYASYVARHTLRTPAKAPDTEQAVAALHSDAPWELHAFWSAYAPRTAATDTQTAATLERPAVLRRRHARPVSLFGSYQ